jgi:hypothetical protein
VLSGDTIANSAAATVFASKYTMPGNTINAAGRVLRVKAWGTARNNNASVAVTWEVLVGSVVVAAYAAGGNYSANTTARGWNLDVSLICTTSGASGVFEGNGRVEMQTGGNSGNTFDVTTTGNVVDLTTSKDVAIRFTWGTANANNTITKRAMSVEVL